MFAKVFITILLICSVLVHTTPTIKKKPLDCPPNEKYYDCSLEVCYKTCDHITRPPPCPLISADCYKPSCECVKDFLRLNGTCVPYNKCPHGNKFSPYEV